MANSAFQKSSIATPVSVANWGTGATTFTANNVLLGNGTSALQVVAPWTSWNILTSNGTTWSSTAPAASGSLTLKTSSTGTTANSITFSSLALNTDEQYLFIIRYANAASGTSGAPQFQIKLNADTGSNYSYAYQSYSNTGWGTSSNNSTSSGTIFNCNGNVSNQDSDWMVTLWITKWASNKANLKWHMFDSDAGTTVRQTSEWGGFYNGSADITSVQVGWMSNTNNTKAWTIYVYKYWLT